MRPALPKYRDTWDPDQALHYLSSSISSSLQDLSVKTLTLRTATLLALLTGQRGQALLKVSDIRFAKDLAQCRIVFSDIRKTSKPSAHTVPSEILAYNANPNLCFVRHLVNYIKKTDRVSSLFISYAKPFGPVSRNTFSRWVKAVLAEAGIDTSRYSGHSTRAAAWWLSVPALTRC